MVAIKKIDAKSADLAANQSFTIRLMELGHPKGFLTK
jgi:hypothetical protein